MNTLQDQLRNTYPQFIAFTTRRTIWHEAADKIDALESDYKAKCSALELAHTVDDELRKDAKRYQWLRSRIPGSAYRIAGVIYSEGGAGVDKAIDDAMGRAEKAIGPCT